MKEFMSSPVAVSATKLSQCHFSVCACLRACSCERCYLGTNMCIGPSNWGCTLTGDVPI